MRGFAPDALMDRKTLVSAWSAAIVNDIIIWDGYRRAGDFCR